MTSNGLIQIDCDRVEDAKNWVNDQGRKFAYPIVKSLESGGNKLVYVGFSRGGEHGWWGSSIAAKRANMKYNFETGIWSNDQGHKFKNGIRVE